MAIGTKQIIGLVACLLLAVGVYYTTNTQSPATQRLLLTSYTTTSTRSSGVNSFCPGLTRSTLIDSNLASQYTVFNSQISTMFSLDGNSLIVNLLNGDTATVQTQVSSSATDMGFFVGPFIFGLAAIILTAPFMICCCACPFSCPPKCCRKRQDEQYTKCQLYWPVTVLVAALLLCIGACIAGFSQSEMLPQSITSVSCATSIIFDDIINGNVTNDGTSFFLGLNQLKTQLGNLNGNLSTINTSMTNLSPSSANMTAVNNAGSTALSNTAKIPANVNAGGNMAAIVYSTPLNSASPSGTINSNFPTALGSSTTGGLVGTLYDSINAVISSISTISTAASNFVAEVTNFQAAVAALQTTVQSFTDSMTTLDSSLLTNLQTLNQNSGDIQTGVKLLYGLTLGIASTMLLGVLMVAFCDKIHCRYLIYLSCVILAVIGILGFALTAFFSIIVPGLYFGCQFMDFSLASSANFNTNFASLIPDSTYRGYISTCLATSSGDILTAMGGGAVAAVQNLSTSLTSINTFNSSTQASTLTSNLSTLSTYIGYYQTGVLNDITDTSSIAIISQLSQASSYSGCTTPAFSTDSWIPSTSQSPVYAACQISGGSNATSTQCGGANFAGASGGCNGCMDTSSILNTATYSTKASVLTALNNRYTAGGCSTFNNEMANTWDQYYLVKSNAFSPITTRTSTATTSINQFSANLTGTLNTTFNNAVTAMNSVTSTVTDPKYGLVAGLNCRIIGEDFTSFTNTFCQSFFTVSYFSRLALGMASFGILFSLWCGICTGVRFYKHSINKLNSIQNVGLSEDQVQDITNTNFVKPKVLQ